MVSNATIAFLGSNATFFTGLITGILFFSTDSSDRGESEFFFGLISLFLNYLTSIISWNDMTGIAGTVTGSCFSKNIFAVLSKYNF